MSRPARPTKPTGTLNERERATHAHVRAAALELAAGLVLLDEVAAVAADFASPGYRPDAYDRTELAHRLELVRVWKARHEQLLEWAKRTGRRR